MLKFVVAPKATQTMPISPVLTYEEASNIKVLTYEEASNINKTKIRGWGGGVGEMKEVSSGLIFCPLKIKTIPIPLSWLGLCPSNIELISGWPKMRPITWGWKGIFLSVNYPNCPKINSQKLPFSKPITKIAASLTEIKFFLHRAK